jgi:hypothetical protein
MIRAFEDESRLGRRVALLCFSRVRRLICFVFPLWEFAARLSATHSIHSL